MRTVQAEPYAGSLIEGMRDIGYSLETAVADVIDNSIAAGANRIDIMARFQGNDSRVSIVDDGGGMLESELVEAMRPGTRSPTEARAAGDLGRFGLGLKTASFSQCRELTVVTRQAGITSAAIWDLDHVVAENRWELQLPADPESLADASLLGPQGTVVAWRRLDRLAGEDGQLNEDDFNRLLGGVEDHLALVFHRFLLGRSGARKITIAINGRPVAAFDPFFTSRSLASPVDEHSFRGGKMRLQAFTLPYFSAVSPREWERNAGREGYLRSQGFYVFRGNRLILHSTWFGLKRQEEATKLTRVALELSTEYDAFWKVDVKKASAQPPAAVRRYLKNKLEALNIQGKKVIRHKGAAAVSVEFSPVWLRVENGDTTTYKVDMDHPAIADLIASVPQNLRVKAVATIGLIASSIPLPALYSDMASSPETTQPAEMPFEDLVETAVGAAVYLFRNLKDREKVLNQLRIASQFSESWSQIEPHVHKALNLEEAQ